MKQGSNYRLRIADGLVEAALKRAGAVQITGPKWCGKTTTAEQFARTSIYFQDPDHRDSYQRIASEQPSLLLRGERPLLLDEWQDAPQMWDAVRFAVDREQELGQFILTGSTIHDNRHIAHSGTGRFAKVTMRTMSLFESGESSGEVTLASVLNGDDVYSTTKTSLDDIARIIVRGGWPLSVTHPDPGSQERARDYVESIIDSDISRVDGVDKNPIRVRLLLRSLARNESTPATMTTLRTDMDPHHSTLSTNTISVYLTALRRLYVTEDQEAWPLAVRSKTAIRTSSVRRFCDPSLPAAILNLTPDKMLVDFNAFGVLFESLCIRDLRVYAESVGAKVYHYLDGRGLEADAIIEWPDGRWGAIEIKLQSTQEEKAVESLNAVQRLVHSQHGGPASFLMIVTSDGIARRRPDGIYTVPITCLAP